MRTPEVQEMINKAICNPQGLRVFINNHNEIIIAPKLNAYFRLEDVETELEFKCKCLEWLSFFVADNHWFGEDTLRRKIERFINYMLDTHFNHDDYQYIYEKLGNRVNHNLTVQFVESGYDMNLLGKAVLV